MTIIAAKDDVIAGSTGFTAMNALAPNVYGPGGNWTDESAGASGPVLSVNRATGQIEGQNATQIRSCYLPQNRTSNYTVKARIRYNIQTAWATAYLMARKTAGFQAKGYLAFLRLNSSTLRPEIALFRNGLTLGVYQISSSTLPPQSFYVELGVDRYRISLRCNNVTLHDANDDPISYEQGVNWGVGLDGIVPITNHFTIDDITVDESINPVRSLC